MSTLQDDIKLINRELRDRYGRICDERSKKHFELLLGDIHYEIEEADRRDVRELNHEFNLSSKQSRNS